MDEDQISDQMLIAAARKRLLAELAGGGGGGDAARIVNNVYGAGGGSGGGGGVFEGLQGGGAGGGGEDPFDYFVDITRENVPEGGQNPLDPDQTLAGGGWAKRVHRFRGSKKKAPMGPMVQEPGYRE